MGVKILFFSRGTLGQNSMFPEKGGQNSIFFPSALKKGGQNRGAYQPTSLKGCPPGVNSLTRIDEDISDIFWAAGIFVWTNCLRAATIVLGLLI